MFDIIIHILIITLIDVLCFLFCRSLSMTALSNLLAVATMPLNLYLYAGHWTSAELTVPYVNIVISFLMVFVPVIIGMALNWKWPKKAPIIVKVKHKCHKYKVVRMML